MRLVSISLAAIGLTSLALSAVVANAVMTPIGRQAVPAYDGSSYHRSATTAAWTTIVTRE
jgi:hypothetical protein